jgi:uncharacterized coiled-coil DUF342 family protein
MMLDRFSERTNQLEDVIKDIAIEITKGTFVEKLPPEKVWEKTGDRVNLMVELIKELREYLYLLKPEKVPTTQNQVNSIFERLDVFKEYLGVEQDAVMGSSSASMDELRKALVNISNFINYCKSMHSEPNEVIYTILQLRENQVTDSPQLSPEKLKHLGELMKEAKERHQEYNQMSNKIASQLDEMKEEYDRIIYSVKRKVD